MIAIDVQNADAAWRGLAEELRNNGRLQPSRDQPTKELLHVSIAISDPRQRVVFARPINPAFAIAELIWMLAGFDDLSFLVFWNPRMRLYSDDGFRLCGAYGYRLGSQPKIDERFASRFRHWTRNESSVDQLKMAIEALKQTSYTRQVVLQIWDGTIDMPNPSPRSKDVPCNLVSHLMLRDGKLEWLQIMRSNDLFWGLPYNLIQFTTLQEIMAGWLDADVGSYVHISDSLHAYERHWTNLDELDLSDSQTPQNLSDLRVQSYEKWQDIIARLVDRMLALSKSTDADELISIGEAPDDLPSAYREWVVLLTAEALRRRGFPDEAKKTVIGAGNFWASSWRQWALSSGKVDKSRKDKIELPS